MYLTELNGSHLLFINNCQKAKMGGPGIRYWGVEIMSSILDIIWFGDFHNNICIRVLQRICILDGRVEGWRDG